MGELKFRVVGGPHDGDVWGFPPADVPTSMSKVCQDSKYPMGTLHRYFLNKLTGQAVFEGVVQIKGDEK